MNVLFFHALIDDILPVVVMISLVDIREGEELLSDYGVYKIYIFYCYY